MTAYRVGQVLVKRVGLHVTEDNRVVVLRVTPTSIQVKPIGRKRGHSSKDGPKWSIKIARADSTLRPE